MKESVYANQEKIFEPVPKLIRLIRKYPIGTVIVTSDIDRWTVTQYDYFKGLIRIDHCLIRKDDNLINYDEDKIKLIRERQ